jgi:anoctamin-1
VKSRIVNFILDRKRFCRENCNDYAFGIERLIADQVYIAAYPLHDVSFIDTYLLFTNSMLFILKGEVYVPGSVRNLLFTKWAAVSKWNRYQPLDAIKEYFGVKIALYFAWCVF